VAHGRHGYAATASVKFHGWGKVFHGENIWDTHTHRPVGSASLRPRIATNSRQLRVGDRQSNDVICAVCMVCIISIFIVNNVKCSHITYNHGLLAGLDKLGVARRS